MKNNKSQAVLFDAEELSRIEPNSLWSQSELDEMIKQDSPEEEKSVTVLGITFENDAARREYFREELRKKLPELRNIEGFPIGSDDDIINLSDPPYYTACPNPWLNDFIVQWEEEKKELVKQGKREEEFEVKEPYASDVSEGKYHPIYLAHGYHTKVPHQAIMRYILHYTQPGDIVFDGFAGTGMTGVAAYMCGSNNDVAELNERNPKTGVRHGICSDLSPIASFIAAGYNTAFSVKKFENEARTILEKANEELGWMFETKVEGKTATINYVIYSDVYICPSCGKEIVLWDQTVDTNNKTIKDTFICPECGSSCSKKTMTAAWDTKYDSILDSVIRIKKKKPVRINYSIGKYRSDKEVDDYDLDILNRIEQVQVAHPLTSKLQDGDKMSDAFKCGITHTHLFYPKRNYIYILKLWDLSKGNVQLLNWLTSNLLTLTYMYRFRFTGGGIMNGTLYVPSLCTLLNPNVTLKLKINSRKATYSSYMGQGVVGVNSATSIPNLPTNSVDYIFVDPPFGANIMYSELNSIWEAWLQVKTNTAEEAIVNNTQNKSIVEYQLLIKKSLQEFYRVLKPEKWMTVEFSNTSASVWNSIQNALQGVGFILSNVSALDKKQGSFNAVTSTTAVKQDLVITCYKPSDELTDKMEDYSKSADNVWDFIDEYLLHLPVHIERNNATTTVIERSPKILFDRLISYYVVKGYPVPLDAADFQAGLRERYIERDGMFFTATQAAEYDEKKKLAPEFVPMGIIVSDEANGIQWLKTQLQSGAKTYQEIQPEWMQAINGTRKNDIIPELKQLLEENFIEEDGGKWRLPNIQDDKDVNALRNKSLLREFKIYVETAQKPKGKIKEARVEALRTGFKQCYIDKDFQTIVTVGDKIPQNLLTEDEVLLQFYDIAQNKL